MMKKIIFYIFSLFVCIPGCFAQDSIRINNDSLSLSSGFHAEKIEITKNQADSAYMNADYATAIQIYENLLLKGEAAELYYNLGNSYYKTDNIAKAILNYERALLLKPGNGDIRANLEIARSKTVDKVNEIPDIFFVSWIKSLINSTSVDVWARWGIACFILLIIALYLFFFSKRISLKKAGFISGIIMLVFVICTNMFALYQKKTLVNRNTAIIMSPSVTIRSTPNESGTSLFILHEGRKVQIKDNSMKGWKEIALEDGKVGWVATTDIEII